MTKRFLIIAVLGFCAGGIVFIAFNAVPLALTSSDVKAIETILTNSEVLGNTSTSTYDEQLNDIKTIQRAVFEISPQYKLIPPGNKREPADLLQRGQGYCFDRARTLEKAYRYKGYKTRYAAIYSTDQTHSPLKSLLSPGGKDVRSHAVVEVLTPKGWILVDSVNIWLALDNQGNPLDLESIQHMAETQDFSSMSSYNEAYFIFHKPFTYIYGLYSRHGKFYPPYLPFPDINWSEILYNFK